MASEQLLLHGVVLEKNLGQRRRARLLQGQLEVCVQPIAVGQNGESPFKKVAFLPSFVSGIYVSDHLFLFFPLVQGFSPALGPGNSLLSITVLCTGGW